MIFRHSASIVTVLPCDANALTYKRWNITKYWRDAECIEASAIEN